MTQRLTGIVVLLALATAASQAASQPSEQVTVTSTRQGGPPQGLPQIVGDFPGLQGANTRPMEAGGGLIVGRVVDGVEASGVSGAIVTLTLAGFTPLRVQADSDGRFAFRGLPKGSFSISTSRHGYVDGAAGRTRPGGPGRSVTLTDDQRMGDVDIPMWRFAAITGIVLDENNEPLVGVQVRVLRRDYVAGRRRLTMGATDTTDDRGHYRVSALQAGEYIVAVPIVQRQSPPDQLMAGLRDGAMAGVAGAGGNVTMMAVRVEATATATAGAPIVISSADGAAPPAGTTDDGLPLTYQTTFHTGAVSAARATPIVLSHGEERTGIDFTMVPVRAVSISGTVTGPDGPASNVQLQLVPADAEDVISPIETATTSSDSDGHFTFAMVPAGQYTLRGLRQARGGGENFSFTSSEGNTTMMVRTTVAIERGAPAAPLPEAPTVWAEMPIGVGARDLADVGISLRPGLTVSGSVVFNGSAAQPTPEQRANLSISLEPADGRTAGLMALVRGRVDANGTFTTMGVPAGKYILRVSGAPQGWTLRDALHTGRDITSTAIELDGEGATGVVLTFDDRATELNGTVRESGGNADAEASVIVFPTDPQLWIDTGSQPRRLRQVRAGQDGRFTVGGLPTGDYYVIAVEDAAIAAWQAPEFLNELARAAAQVRIGDGETRTQNLTTVKGGR